MIYDNQHPGGTIISTITAADAATTVGDTASLPLRRPPPPLPLSLTISSARSSRRDLGGMEEGLAEERGDDDDDGVLLPPEENPYDPDYVRRYKDGEEDEEMLNLEHHSISSSSLPGSVIEEEKNAGERYNSSGDGREHHVVAMEMQDLHESHPLPISPPPLPLITSSSTSTRPPNGSAADHLV